MAGKKKPVTQKAAHQKAEKSLKETGLRVTKPRMAILHLLIRRHGPFTMDEIHKEVKRYGVDRVTVYRCVDAFQDAGIVRRCDFGTVRSRYEYQGYGESHHHHVVCRRCRDVEDLKQCLVDGIENSLKKAGYSQITHSLEFFGVCAKCSGGLRPAPKL